MRVCIGACAVAASRALPAATCRVVCRVQRKKASIAAGGNEKTFAESGDVSWLNKVRGVAPWLRLVVSSCCGQVKLCDSRYRCRPRHSWPVAVDPGAAAGQCRTAGLVALAAATAAYLSYARTSKRPMRRATGCVLVERPHEVQASHQGRHGPGTPVGVAFPFGVDRHFTHLRHRRHTLHCEGYIAN